MPLPLPRRPQQTVRVSVKYTTLRRWLQQGKISEECVQRLTGGKWRRQRKRVNAVDAETDHQCPGPAENDDAYTGRQEDVSTSGSLSVDEHMERECEEDSMDTAVEVQGSDQDSGSERDSDSSTLVVEPASLYVSNSNLFSSSSWCSLSDRDCSDDHSVSYFDDNGDKTDMSSKQIDLEDLNKPLTDTSHISKFETLVMILHLAMRHGMTEVFVEDLLRFVNVIVGVPNGIPNSKLKLFSPGGKSIIHFYCPDCDLYLGLSSGYMEDIICSQCSKKQSVASLNGGFYFVTLDIKRQISDVLARPHLELTQKYCVSGVISDITNAGVYECLSANNGILSNPNALTINFNIGGSPVFKSGPNGLWPVNFVLNEIHPSQRYLAENMMLAGLWCGKKSASVDIFLKPIVDELNLLEKEGVVWRRQGVVVHSPIYALCCITDSAARPEVQKFNQFNSSFACPYCEHPNTPITYYEAVTPQKKFSKKKTATTVHSNRTIRNVDNSIKNSPLYEKKCTLRYLRGVHSLRANKKVRRLMKLVKEKKESVMGIAGKSILCDLKHFDMVYGFGLDYMHATLIGVTKRLAELWFATTGEPYSIGLMSSVDRRITNVVMPTGMPSPRPMSEHVHWHASEWRGFLLYYGLPCLVDILPIRYYNHFKKLVLGIYLLSKEIMLHDEIETANTLLHEFVWTYQDLYGERNMVYDVHLTMHLAKVVSQLGGLFNFSMFPYEGANGRLVRMAKGTTGAATQIARKYQMTKTFSKLIQSNYEVSNECLEFCSKIVGFQYAKNDLKFENVTLIGTPQIFILSEEQREALQRKGIDCETAVEVHHTAIYNSTPFRGIQSSKNDRCGDSCVRLISGEFMLIDLIVKRKLKNGDKGSVFCVCRSVNVSTELCPFMVPHIKRCCLDPYGDVVVVDFVDFASKCMFYKCDDKYFVSEFANSYESD